MFVVTRNRFSAAITALRVWFVPFSPTLELRVVDRQYKNETKLTGTRKF